MDLQLVVERMGFMMLIAGLLGIFHYDEKGGETKYMIERKICSIILYVGALLYIVVCQIPV
jgi:hypothetical protein